jgi:hypothetical protein
MVRAQLLVAALLVGSVGPASGVGQAEASRSVRRARPAARTHRTSKPRPRKPRAIDLERFGAFSTPKTGIASDYVFLVTAVGPARLAEVVAAGGRLTTPMFFASLIADRDGKRGTIGNLGLILDVDASNVIGTHHFDTAVQINTRYRTNAEIARQVSQQYPPLNPGFGMSHVSPGPGHRHVPSTPRELLARTNMSHNEVLVLSESVEGRVVRITGFFIRTDGESQRDLANQKEVAAISAAAEQLGLPLVRIPAQSRSP